MNKIQLQQEVQNLEAELQEFQEELYFVDIEIASVGDVLKDGSIVLQKSNGHLLLVSPKNTEVKVKWSKEFAEVFQKLKEQGFNPSQWFVPTLEQLHLAYETLPNVFTSVYYWSSTEGTDKTSWSKNCAVGTIIEGSKVLPLGVRAFRCVSY